MQIVIPNKRMLSEGVSNPGPVELCVSRSSRVPSSGLGSGQLGTCPKHSVMTLLPSVSHSAAVHG